jgi:hypothetical protein
MWSTRLAIAVAAIFGLGGCVVAPGPYPYGPYSYYGNGPAYVAPPAVVVGGGWGWGWGWNWGWGHGHGRW